jgi:hypothetical protein
MVRRKSTMPMITKVLYRDCGLIMACFKGYIELLDGVDFVSKGKWNNKTEINTGQSVVTKLKNPDDDELFAAINRQQKKTEISYSRKCCTPAVGKKTVDEDLLTTAPNLSKTPGKKQDKKDKKSFVTIDCLDYSSALDLIAFGGVSGGVGVLDSTTLSFKGMYPAHLANVTALYFNDPELQMISMSQEGEIALWDAQKMSII